MLLSGDLDVGAGRLRQFGRLALFHNFEKLSNLLRSSLEGQLNKRCYFDLRPYCWVACGWHWRGAVHRHSTSGQTVRRGCGFAQSPVVLGHFVLPKGFTGTPEVQINSERAF